MRKVKSVARYDVLIALPPKGRITLPSKRANCTTF